ncbi:hypothetical protein D3C80_1585430 [compost metagenome]
MQAVEPRQHQVEHHQVRFVPAKRFQHVVAPGDHPDMKVVALQVAGDQFRQRAVVFDQENVRHKGRSSEMVTGRI